MTRTNCPRRDIFGGVWLLRMAQTLALVWAGTAAAFEQDHRMNGLTLQFGTDSFATANALGSAITGVAQTSLQSAIASQVASGEFSVLLEMPGLADLTGTSVPSLQFGVVNGGPALSTNNPAPYSGTSDLDWWYAADAAGVASNGVPKVQMAGSIVARALTAAAAEFRLTSNPLGTTGAMAMSSVILTATVGSSSAPLQATNGFPPGHLPSEHIDPGLVSFSSMSNGKWKGNISATSLAAMPYSLSTTTDQGYTSSNSFLDLLVSGATAYGLFVLVRPTQPDQVDTNAPIAGAGPPYTFTANASHIVTGCRDKNGSSVPLATALNAAAYSVYFTFTTDRIIAHNLPSGTFGPPLLSIARGGTNVILTVAAQATATCTIEYKSSLADPNWVWLETFSGTGAPSTIIDSSGTTQARFYRARVQ
jgi:hypothetical protein